MSDIAGYSWINEDNGFIQSVKCLPFYDIDFGYYAKEESHKLNDTDECKQPNSLVCPMKFGKCFNLPGEYYCYCNKEGYFPYNNSLCEYGKYQ